MPESAIHPILSCHAYMVASSSHQRYIIPIQDGMLGELHNPTVGISQHCAPGHWNEAIGKKFIQSDV